MRPTLKNKNSIKSSQQLSIPKWKYKNLSGIFLLLPALSLRQWVMGSKGPGRFPRTGKQNKGQGVERPLKSWMWTWRQETQRCYGQDWGRVLASVEIFLSIILLCFWRTNIQILNCYLTRVLGFVEGGMCSLYKKKKKVSSQIYYELLKFRDNINPTFMARQII